MIFSFLFAAQLNKSMGLHGLIKSECFSCVFERNRQFGLKSTGNSPAKDCAKHRYLPAPFKSEVDPFKREDVLKHLKKHFGIDVLCIPGSLTSQVQSLDVLFDKSLKVLMRAE
jgi:hypothetical protein